MQAALLTPEIRRFIIDHAGDDVAALALKKAPDAGWPWVQVLDQIAARQKAARKMPGWLDIDDIVFPAAKLIEQASSTATSAYKASLVNGQIFADLTAGAGVDALAFAQHFAEGIAVERDDETAARLRHNLGLLDATSCRVVTGNAMQAVDDLPHCDFIYADPQRRDQNKKGLFRLDDCSPDILTLLSRLLAKADRVMIKTSPVLDIHQAVAQLGSVTEVHVVEWQGECREVLYILRSGSALPGDDVPVTAVAVDDQGRVLRSLTFTRADELNATCPFSMPDAYLFEPSPAFMKAGGFRSLAARFGLAKLHPHTHLYTGSHPLADFPGRVFAVQGVYQAGGKGLPLKKANLAVRNFPLSTDALRAKLKLADGGDDYLFACTLADGKKALIHGVRPAS